MWCVCVGGLVGGGGGGGGGGSYRQVGLTEVS